METGQVRVCAEVGRGGMETGKGDTEAGGVGDNTEAGRGDTEAGRVGDNTVAGPSVAGPSVAGQGMQCYKCNEFVEGEKFSEHLSDYHTEEMCDTCGAKVQGTVGLLSHIQVAHYSALISPQKPTLLPPKPVPSLLPPSSSPATPHHNATPLRPTCVNWKGFLPEQFRNVIQEADQVWIAKCLYEPTGQLKRNIKVCWFHPPLEPKPSPPEPGWYYRQRMFIWAPMRMWGIPLKCPQCSRKMNSSGIYRKVREVISAR